MKRASALVFAVVSDDLGAAAFAPDALRRPGAGAQDGRPSSGTATVSGIVVDDHSEPADPPRRGHAVDDRSVARDERSTPTMRAASGSIALAAGSYVLYLASPSHVRKQNGARARRARPTDPGRGRCAHRWHRRADDTGGDHQRHDSLTLRASRLANVGVQLWHWGYSPRTGEPALVRSNTGFGSTDDRGRYRVLSAAGRRVRRRLDRSADRGIAGGISGGQDPRAGADARGGRGHASRRAASAGGRATATVPTYFPGVTRATDAERVVVAAGQERARVDFTMQATPTAAIRGTIAVPAGITDARTIVSVFTPGGDPGMGTGYQAYANPGTGTFAVPGLPPGDYLVTASTYFQPDPAVPDAPTDRDRHRLFGAVPVRIDGRDVTDLVVAVQPGGSVSGRVQFIGAPRAPGTVDGLRIALAWAGSAYQSIAPPTPRLIGADGRFSIASVPPGRYIVLTASAPGPSPGAVSDLVSAMSNGLDLADMPFELNGQHIADVVVTVSGASTLLSGSVSTTGGAPAGDGRVIVFSTDRATWRPLARRVSAAADHRGWPLQHQRAPAGRLLHRRAVRRRAGPLVRSVVPAAAPVGIAHEDHAGGRGAEGAAAGDGAMTARGLNRATLARQMLLARETMPATKAVGRLVAMQAQLARPPFVGLWTRLDTFTRDQLIRAVVKKDVVRATSLRGTIHLMTAADFVAFRGAIQPALTKGLQAILRQRLDTFDSHRVMTMARAFFGKAPATFDAFRVHLKKSFPKGDERAMAYAVRMQLPMVQVPCEATWGYDAAADFALADEWLAKPVPVDPNGAAGLQTGRLITRYLAAYGPATIADAQTWSGLAGLKETFEAMRPSLVTFRDEKKRELFDLPDAPRPGDDVVAARSIPA